MFGTKRGLKMHVRNLGYLSLQIGSSKTTFRRLRNLTATSAAYIFRMKHDIYTIGQYVGNYKSSPLSPQNIMNFGPQTAQNGTIILPTLRKFCFLLHCQTSHMDVTDGTQPNFAKR